MRLLGFDMLQNCTQIMGVDPRIDLWLFARSVPISSVTNLSCRQISEVGTKPNATKTECGAFEVVFTEQSTLLSVTSFSAFSYVDDRVVQ